MKNLLPLSFIVTLLILGCANTTPNEPLLDSQIPPDEQLIKISADNLASDFTRGKKRSFQDNDADKKYVNKWLKVSGAVDSSSLKKDGMGYSVTLKTFAADPKVGCIGNYEEKEPELTLEKNQTVTVVGKLVSGGNSSTLYLNPCKVIR